MNTTQPARVSGRTMTLSLVADVALVLLFAGIGRGSHARSATLIGLLDTAWPFLAGVAIMWLVTRAWKRPLAVVATGLPLWIGTVTLGMGLRALTGQGTALPFIMVATITLAVFLVGWRLVVALVQKVRSR